MSFDSSFLEEVADVIDSLHKTPNYSLHGVPMVRVTDVKYGVLNLDGCLRVDHDTYEEFSKRFKPKSGDIVMTRVGTYGVSAMVKDPFFCLGQNTAALIPKNINPKYLYAALNSNLLRAQIEASVVGSTQKTLSLKSIKALQIPRHNEKVEEAIADLIGALDDRINLLRETNATLEAIAQALFKSWFVDFGPVHANAHARAQNQNSHPQAAQSNSAPHTAEAIAQNLGLDAATAALFPDHFQDSDLGPIPAGWRVTTVESFAEKVGMGPFGSNIKVETFVESGVPVISGQHLRQYLVEDTTFNFITNEHAEKLHNSCVFEGDVIFTHAGSIGQVSMLHRHSKYKKYVLSQRQFYLRCNKELMKPEWVVYYFNSAQGQYQLLANTSQVGVPSIARPVSYLKSIKLVMPSKELIDKFSEITDCVHQSVMSNRSNIETLTQLRDTLLPRLISGQLRLPEAEAQIEAVVGGA